MDQVDPLSREDSRQSLGDLRRILESLPDRRENLARLAEIEAATTTHAWTKVSVVATSLTGPKAISQFLESFHSHARDLDQGVRQILEKKYPTSRSRLLHGALQAMLWSTVASYYATGNAPADLLHSFMEAVGVSFYVMASLGYVYFDNVFVPQKFSQLGYPNHLQRIEHCLQRGCEGGRMVDMMSGSLIVPAQFHSEIMARSDARPLRKNLELTAEAAELGAVSPIELVFRNFVDTSHWEKQIQKAIEGRLHAPGSPTRQVEYDSIFYVDPKTSEPKLLLFYRSYRQETKKKPPPNREWEMQAEPQGG